MVPTVSHRITRVPRYSGYHYIHNLYLYRAITVYGQAFQLVLIHYASNAVVLQPRYCRNNTGLG